MNRKILVAGAKGLDQGRREAILEAARAVLGERGYHRATTLEIAARAKTSKRALYALFGSKRGIMEAMISERVREMRRPLDLQPPTSRDAFFAILQRFGVTFMAELLKPRTVTIYRLAITESVHSAELGAALYQAGRLAVTDTVAGLFAEAVARKWVVFADVQEVVGAYMYTLMGDVLMRMLLGIERTPRRSELRKRAELAIHVVLQFDLLRSIRKGSNR
jgi:AcrR family transcriptional regulator